MTVVINNRIPMFARYIQNATAEGLTRAIVYLESAMRVKVGVPAPRLDSSGKRNRRSRRSVVRYAKATSGAPPRKRTGFGQANVRHEMDRTNMKARAGVTRNAAYMGILQVTNHPWIDVTLEESFPMIEQLALSGLRDGMGGLPQK